MFLTGLRPPALGLFAAVLLVLGIVAASPAQQPAVAPGGASTPGVRPAPPTPPTPPPPAETLESLFGASEGLPPIDRLAGTPNMFGDLFAGGTQLAFSAPLAPSSGTFDLPLAGGTPRLKVGENNNGARAGSHQPSLQPLPQRAERGCQRLRGNPAQRSLSVDRFMLGVEKALGNGCWSVGLCMPFAGETNFTTSDVEITGGDVGNLAVILKRIIYQCDCTVASVGLGIDTPTGSDVHGSVYATDFTVHNQAVYLAPYAAFLRKPMIVSFIRALLRSTSRSTGIALIFRMRSTAPVRSARFATRRSCLPTSRPATGCTGIAVRSG